MPLAALVQVRGDWQPSERRRDGLAWLGWLPEAGEENEAAIAALQQVLRGRWRVLQAA